MLNRCLSLLLAVMMMLSLAACSGGDAPASGASKAGDPPASGASGARDGAAPVTIPKASPAPLDGVEAGPTDGIGTPGVDFVDLPVHDAKDWADIKAPAFDLVGSRAVYDDVKYNRADGFAQPKILIQLMEGYDLRTFTRHGEKWTYTLECEGDYAEFSEYWLKYRAKNMGFTYCESSPGFWFFTRRDADCTWWVQVEDKVEYDETIDVSVLRCLTLSPGQSITIDTKAISANPDNEYWSQFGARFYTRPTPASCRP